MDYKKANNQRNTMPPMTTKENIKLQLLKILQARNSDDNGVNSGLGLLLSIGGYGLLLEVDQLLNSSDYRT